MIHVSRAEWNARPPNCVDALDKSQVTLFIVHYSGASRDQSVRSIQNYCMDTKGHCDIDYNRIVRGGYDYMGRGWNVGGHTKDHNSISYGVCMIGVDGDVTDADKQTIRGIYDEVCETLGRQLTMTTHRNVLGSSYTDCPGNALNAWVNSGMPYPSGDDDMTPEESRKLTVQDRLYVAVVEDSDTITNVPLPDGTVIDQPFPLAKRAKKIEQMLTDLNLDFEAAAERAVRKVLGEADGDN